MRSFGENYSVKAKHGTIRTNSDGSTLEVRTVSWYGKPAKLDIRNWDGDKLAKSDSKLLLSDEDAKALNLILSSIFNDVGETTAQQDSKKNTNGGDNPILSKKITIWD